MFNNVYIIVYVTLIIKYIRHELSKGKESIHFYRSSQRKREVLTLFPPRLERSWDYMQPR